MKDSFKIAEACQTSFILLNSVESYGYRFPDFSSILQCEILAIKMTELKWLSTYSAYKYALSPPRLLDYREVWLPTWVI